MSLLVGGPVAYLGVPTLDGRRIDSMTAPAENAPVLARPSERTPPPLIGRAVTVAFCRDGVVSVTLEVNRALWLDLVGEAGEARATFDVHPVAWHTEGEVAVASFARIIAFYLEPLAALEPGAADSGLLWPTDTIVREVTL